MTSLKKYLLVAFTIVVAQSFAQQNVDVLKETTKKTYEVKKDKHKVTYVVAINTTEKQVVKLEKKDKGNLNQDRDENAPVEVSKRVTINNYDSDKMKIELSYYKLPQEELRFVSTSKGLAIISSDNKVHHINDVGEYIVYSGNQIEDIVIVEEFETIK